jgi:hypothetical protein
MAVKNQVLIEFGPTVTPTKIEFLDLETKKAEVKQISPENTGFTRQLGKKFPLIQIAGLRIAEADLLALTLNQDEFLPGIFFSFIDSSKVFTSDAFPTTTPIVSIYLAPSNKMLKSISGDYLITSIRSMMLPNGTIKYDYVGELYVPGLNSNKSIAYSNMTSVDAMRAIAKDLQLGFATNEDQTADRMTWINPNLSYRTFIQQVSDRAYKNEKTFFQVFIDRNYVLNFINVEKQYSRDNEIDITFLGKNNRQDFDYERFEDFTQLDEAIEVPMIMSNSKSTQLDDMKILEYSPISENGDILRIESFRKRVKWYRHNDQGLDFFIEPISDLVPSEGKVHQTPTLTDFTQNDVIKWIGVDYNNAHENYKFARVINMHNEKELSKNQLKVTLNGANFTVPRGSRVKVIIITEVADTIMSSIGLNAESADADPQFSDNPTAEHLDLNLTDFYYVKDVVIRYRKDSFAKPMFSTEMILSKRNWLPDKQKLITPTR